MSFSIIQKIICEQLELDEEDVNLESSLLVDLDMTDLDIADLAMSIEDEFDIEVTEEACDSFETVEDVVNFVDENK